MARNWAIYLADTNENGVSLVGNYGYKVHGDDLQFMACLLLELRCVVGMVSTYHRY